MYVQHFLILGCLPLMLLGCGEGLNRFAPGPESADLTSESAFDPAAFAPNAAMKPLTAEVVINQMTRSGLLQSFVPHDSEKTHDPAAPTCPSDPWEVMPGHDGLVTMIFDSSTTPCPAPSSANLHSFKLVIQQYCSEATVDDIRAKLPSDPELFGAHSLCLNDTHQAYRIHRESAVQVKGLESTITTQKRRNVMSSTGDFCQVTVTEDGTRILSDCGEFQRIVSKTQHLGRSVEIKSDLLQTMLSHELKASKDADRFNQGEVLISVNQWTGKLVLENSANPIFEISEDIQSQSVTGTISEMLP